MSPQSAIKLYLNSEDYKNSLEAIQLKKRSKLTRKKDIEVDHIEFTKTIY